MDPRPIQTVLVRMDKIGDLVLSLPVDEHPACRGPETHWFVSRGMGFIPAHAVPPRPATEFIRPFSPFEFIRMVGWLRRFRPRTIYVLFAPWWVGLAAVVARVPERIGRRSQWHSFLFLNVGVRQKRSRADRHESDFNFDLVEWGSNRVGLRRTTDLNQIKSTALRLAPEAPERTLAHFGLARGEYRVVHPGMAGSALNWPPEFFATLITELAEDGPVVITGTKSDQKYLAALEPIKDNANVHWFVDKVSFTQLLDLLASARSVTAPSTGVLHLAAALGVPAIGIYSPRKVEHPRRWAPRGPRANVLVPRERAEIPDDVMREITVAAVRARVIETERDA